MKQIVKWNRELLLKVAPPLRGGRGLKPLIVVYVVVPATVAPPLRGGRGLKPA